MKKRSVLFMLIAALILSTVGCGGSPGSTGSAGAETSQAQASSGEKISIKFASVSASSHPVVQALNDVFKPKVEELSGGRITVQIFDNGSLGEENSLMEQTQLGTVQMSSVSEILSGVYPKINILNLPYIFESDAQVDKVIDGELGEKIFDELPEVGLVGLGYFENGFRVTSNSKHPINTLSDIAGLKIRTPQTDAQINIFNAFGANVTPLNFNELFSALQQGVADGQENGYNTIVTQSFYEVQPYIAETNHMWGSFSIIANADWWNSLSAEDQAIIQQAVNEASTYEREVSRAVVSENKQVCIDHGVEITTPDLAELRTAVDSVYEDFYARYPNYKSLVEEILAAKG